MSFSSTWWISLTGRRRNWLMQATKSTHRKQGNNFHEREPGMYIVVSRPIINYYSARYLKWYVWIGLFKRVWRRETIASVYFSAVRVVKLARERIKFTSSHIRQLFWLVNPITGRRNKIIWFPFKFNLRTTSNSQSIEKEKLFYLKYSFVSFIFFRDIRTIRYNWTIII